MRIIGGQFKRRLIHPPRNLPVRPTTDLAKESLFNILSNRIDLEDNSALDLFSGTGSIAYEFASRGCRKVILVEKNPQCLKFIRSTIRDLGMDTIQPLRADVFSYISSTADTFDIIFADPPYDLERLIHIPEEIFKHQLLNPAGLLVVEHPREIDFSQKPGYEETRRYGHVNFSFFRNEGQ